MLDFKSEIELVIIDPQNDFMPLPDSTLPVPGALDDAKRLARLIKTLGAKIDDIHVTMDTHQRRAIFHPICWVDKKGRNPEPLKTVIEYDMVKSGEWRSDIDVLQPIFENYVRVLDEHKRYKLIIWTYHCLFGTPGHNVEDHIGRALGDWEMKYKARVDYVVKGHNPYTEHYSAVQADVPNDDPTTQMNTRLIETLQNARKVWICGQASSHCVANTGRDIADQFGVDSVKQLVFIEDCMSPVQGYEQLAIDFLADMKKRGAEITTSAQLLS